MTVQIRYETISDRQAIWDVNRAAFETEAEANLVDALRAGSYAKVSLVAEADTQIVGHVLFSSLVIVTGDGMIDALSLAPISVLPSHQRQGIGSQLIVEGLNYCREQGHKVVTVLGEPRFYSRFGFSAELAKSLASPFGGGEAWMALELVPGSLTGTIGRVEYSSPFQAFL